MRAEYFHVKDGKCAEQFGVSEVTSLLIFRNFDFSPLQYDGQPNDKELRKAIKDASRPALIEFTEEIVAHIFEEGNDAIILFTDNLDEDFVRIFEDAA